ncbi:MAG: DUF4328 domain-containing protein [Mariniblastus sp.]
MSQNPFNAPQSTSPPADFSKGQQYTYRPLGVLSILIMLFVVATCLAHLLISTVETIGFLMYPNFTDPNAEVGSQAEMNLIYAIGGAAILNVIVYLVAVIAGCMFSYRSNANLRSFNAKGLEFTPGWSGGWWFVPIASLVKPFNVISEIYRHSTPSSKTWHLGLWWAFWIIGNILGQIEFRLSRVAVDLGGGGVALSWASTLMFCFAGALWISITRTISKSQAQTAEPSVHPNF